MTPRRVATEPLAPAELHVWRLAIDGTAIGPLAAVLDEAERTRALRFAFDRDRNQFIATRGWLRILLGQYLGLGPEEIGFMLGAQGKPALATAAPPLHFNVSHSGSRAILAFALDRELGADIEAIAPARDLPDLATTCFSPSEQEVYRADGRPGTFYRFWTGKEAYIKAVGGGLSIPLQAFSVGLERLAGRSATVATDPALPDLTVEWLPPIAGYEAAVAAAGADWRMRVFDLPG